ncbi:hypothetical protein EP10_002665 [Geobacillus icigianus]|uniref:Uncharacterized protein n=1 Tax=Geobacillus icigianus TaxID=1430331 RepID=A0ABU6BIU9_9BACL|nr:hypothetical protein [Geobacillus icigianus]
MITKGIQPLTDPLFYFVAPISRYEKRIRLYKLQFGFTWHCSIFLSPCQLVR